MKDGIRRYSLIQRFGALALAAMLVFGIIPVDTYAESAADPLAIGEVTTVVDPDTVSRPVDVYGQDTENAGKVTVGKSVSDTDVTVNGYNFEPAENNFIVTVSQTAQVMGLASESEVPIDAVFVLDTSGSMGMNNTSRRTGRAEAMVAAANSAIETLMAANENNRVAVVAFSSAGYGGSTNNAANVLSQLDHYTGQAASNHLRWANSNGSAYNGNLSNTDNYGIGTNYNYILGRANTGNAGRRNGGNGGTNIQAGIALGAQLLTADTNQTTVTTDKGVVTRMPFLIVLSDGQPTYISNSGNWYNPSQTGQQGDGSNPFEGAGFVTMLTAAYYKSKITEKYYGTTDGRNQCSVYTIGVELDELSGNNEALAQITMDPKTYTAGDYAEEDADSYYNYGNNWDSNNWNKSDDNGIKTYWENYLAGDDFDVRTDDNQYFEITDNSIVATRDYVTSIAYNDGYYGADDIDSLETVFENLVNTIQQKAISAPTHVNTAVGADFSGYVTFTDPIGEYMEVKDVKGILADGYLYRGASFAQNLKAGNDEEFNALLREVLQTRMLISGSNIDVDAFLDAAVASDNQANYVDSNNFDNSIVWWGNGFTPAGEQDEQVQVLGFADNDTVEYIEQAREDGTIPADADYVCRSYFYYGTAGGTNPNPDHEYLYFVVRVQRSLTAPYQQTVVVSAPASLLSMETVLITEDTTGDETTYTALVESAQPARVVYEVGLRSDINAYNVEQILAEDPNYLGETAEFDGEEVNTNYNAATGEYTFYTNDWNRGAAESSHERAMTTATFDAAVDNAFYTYQEDTAIYVKDGDNYVLYTGTAKPVGTGYYYARDVYDWAGEEENDDGSYNATKRIEYIAVDLPDTDAISQKDDGNWYIAKGVYKASALTGGEDTLKDDPETSVYGDGNFTQTSDVVAHPHRTVSETDSHYTVYLGNNGKLTLKSEDTKTVSITKPDETVITTGDGKVVVVGDTLAYTIKVMNGEDTAADATVTDVIPRGTAYVPGSAGDDGVYDEATRTITWNLSDIPAGEYVEVSFEVTVTVDALSGEMDVVTIDNTAHVRLENGFEYDTNTTHNPPEGKKVVDTSGNLITDTVDVPDVLVYRIRWQNDAVDENGNPAVAKKVVISDIIPVGTSYVANSASHPDNVVYDPDAGDNGTITWTFENVAAGASGVVSFRVNVNASADDTITNGAEIEIDDDPRVTNQTEVAVKMGDLVLSKDVVEGNYPNALNQEFTLNITEIGRGMNGTYAMTMNGTAVEGGITFTNGVATVTIKDGDEIKISGIPAGAIISVTETAKPGFTPEYSYTTVNGTTATSDAEGRVTIVEAAEGTSAVSVAVENTYAPAAVPFTLKGTKVLDTDVLLTDTVFGFTAYASDENGNVASGASFLTGEVTVSSTKKEATITFSPVTFTTTGTYHYLISEINGGVTGIDYAANQYLLTVVVSDDGSGVLKTAATLKERNNADASFGASAAYTDSDVTFTNTYAPLETQLVLEGTKVLNGRTLNAGEFSFVVTENGAVVSTGSNDDKGVITFQPITYTTIGEHTYTITEVNGGLHGVEYSDASYTVTVKVEDQNGRLVATPSYPSGGVKFTNEYTPDGITVTLEADKELRNLSGDSSRVLKDKEFNFVVTENGDVVSSGMNDADGDIVFAPIGFTIESLGGATEKTFEYTISEVIPDVSHDPYMDYDESTFKVTVKVTYDANEGELSAVVTYPDGGVKFTNTQYPSSIEVTPKGSKETTVKSGSTANIPSDATFSFTVINVATNNEAGVGVGSANGEFTFSTLSFSEAGTYKYWIKETHAGQESHGITYDDAIYLMEVVVTLTDGKLEASTSYYALKNGGDAAKAEDYTEKLTSIPDFENEYDAKGQIAITAKKVLENHTLKAGDFAFRLVRQDNGHEITGVVAANGNIQFATLYYDLSEFAEGQSTKTIHYEMSEVIPEAAKLPGVTYDTRVRDVYITITHNEDGTISAMVTDADGKALTNAAGTALAPTDSNVTFTNTYAPEEGTTATIEATKNLTGRDLKDGEFSFELYHVDDQGKETLVDTTTNDADGKISFTRPYPANVLNGADSRVIKYVIREANNYLGGVEYDKSEFEVVVTITDNKDGTLSSSVSYPDGAPTFNNTYDAQDTEFVPEATKVLKNRTMSDNEFSFVVKQGDTVVSTGWSKADNSVSFSPIGYEKEDLNGKTIETFEYTISEVKGSLTGVDYDNTVYKLVVTVTDKGDGTMSTEGKYFDANNKETSAVFTNTYTPANVSVQLKASKTLTGRDMVAGEFSFVVKEGDTVVATGGNATDAKAGGSADVIFSNIGYDLADLEGAASKDFIYSISEIETDQSGVDFDTEKVYYAKVTLTNNTTTGKLETSVKYYSDPECTTEVSNVAFNNSYDPADASMILYADKTLINKALEEGEFTFTLTDSNGQTQTAKNDANGTATFEAITYNAPGTYVYTISESVTDTTKADRYTLDDSFTVVVTVTDDNRGQLHAVAAYYVNYKGDDSDVDLGGAEFINRYTAPGLPVSLSTEIGATKTVTAPDGITYSPEDFEFVVTDVTGATIKGRDEQGKEVDMIGTSDDKGVITFPDFYFSQAGEYHYWIHEADSEKGGIIEDGRTWEVHILVRYNAGQTDIVDSKGDEVAPGQLYVGAGDVQTYLVGRATADTTTPAFVNTYTPNPVSLTLTAKKALEGRPLNDREFTFHLIEKIDGQEIIRAEGHNDAEGSVKFELSYTEVGEHAYFIREFKPSTALNGVTYDETAYAAGTVVITDNGEGQLLASYSGGADGATGVTIKNTYSATDAATAIIRAYKTLEGIKALEDGEFTFELVDKDGKVAATATNDAAGNVVFTLTDLKTVGEFTYTMREKDEDKAGVTYDHTSYEVTVTVTDDYNGKLNAEVKYDTTDGEVPTFENKFTPAEIDVVLSGTKKLSGRDLKEGEFEFQVLDSEGEVVATAENTADGKITFSDITLDAIGEYTYTVIEVKGSDKNIVYDNTKFTVTVNVTSENGVLKAEITYPSDGVVFENEYEKPDPNSPDTGDHTPIILSLVMMWVSGGCIIALLLRMKKRITGRG